MDADGLLLLAQVVLPDDILNKFTMTKVGLNNSESRICLDEIVDYALVANLDIESKEFLT